MEILFILVLIMFSIFFMIVSKSYNKFARRLISTYLFVMTMFMSGFLMIKDEEDVQVGISLEEKESLVQELVVMNRNNYPKRDLIEYIPKGIIYKFDNLKKMSNREEILNVNANFLFGQEGELINKDKDFIEFKTSEGNLINSYYFSNKADIEFEETAYNVIKSLHNTTIESFLLNSH